MYQIEPAPRARVPLTAGSRQLLCPWPGRLLFPDPAVLFIPAVLFNSIPYYTSAAGRAVALHWRRRHLSYLRATLGQALLNDPIAVLDFIKRFCNCHRRNHVRAF